MGNTFNAVTDTNDLAKHESIFNRAIHAGVTPQRILQLVLQFGPSVLHVLELLLNELPKTDDTKTPTVSTPATTGLATHHTSKK